MNLEICGKCKDKVAVWCYAPSTDSKRSPYYCDDCVPRGCSCNSYDMEEFPQMLEEYRKDKTPYKIVEGSIIPIDDEGREFPCCEFFYEAEGWEVD